MTYQYEIDNAGVFCGRVMKKYINEDSIILDLQSFTGIICIKLTNNGHIPQVGDIIEVSKKNISSISTNLVEAQEVTILTKTHKPELFREAYLEEMLPREMMLLHSTSIRNAIYIRSKVLSGTRKFLSDLGFLEVETPILVENQDIAPVPHFGVKSQYDANLYFLRICPENYLKRLIVSGFDKVFELGKNFRDEVITGKNTPEFTVMECYQAYGNYKIMMQITENLLAFLAEEINGTTKIIFKGHEVDLKPPWKRLDFNQALNSLIDISLDTYPDPGDLRSALEKRGILAPGNLSYREMINFLAESVIEPSLVQPTFLIDHPAETICVAKRHEEKPHLIERFEGFIAGVEFAHGFSELTDSVDQKLRMHALLDEKVAAGFNFHNLDEAFLQALDIGLPPTGGLGIGIDRIVMLFTNLPISDTITFLPK